MRPSVITVGAFDGVHRGHRALLQRAVEEAHRLNAGSAAVTFNPHPDRVIRPTEAPPELTDLDERVELIRSTGIEDVWVVPFSREVSQMSPQAFLSLLEARWKIARLWVGADFALGRNRSGTLDVLRAIAQRDGWSLEVLTPRADAAGHVISSTRIRSLLNEGDVAGAALLLGRPYRVCGPLRLADSEEEEAEVVVRAERAMPSAGHYLVWLDEAGTRPAQAEVLPRRAGEPASVRLRVHLPPAPDATRVCLWFVQSTPPVSSPASGRGDWDTRAEPPTAPANRPGT